MEYFSEGILYRLPFYIALGIITEFFYTAFSDLISPNILQSWRVKQKSNPMPIDKTRNVKAVGYSFLWMLPIYACLVFVEPLSVFISPSAWWVRGLIYLVMFWLVEFIAGGILKLTIGVCPWDYSYSRWSVKGWIRWDMAPQWFLFGLFVEIFSQKLVALTPALQNVI